MIDVGGNTPKDFPLPPIDRKGNVIAAGDKVVVASVESCAHNLPAEDQSRLRSVVGQFRTIIEIDRFGFVRLDSESADNSANFSLLPGEVEVA